MSRRDTILIAVLINMALLVVLFVGALKPVTSVDLVKAELPVEIKAPKTAMAEKPSLDQVDSILSKFVENEVKAEAALEVAAAEVSPPQEIERRSDVKEVIVRSGDVLEKIAKVNHTSVEEIMKLNRLNDTRLQIGQILYVPDTKGIPNEVRSSSSKTEVKYYTVRGGDNPWTIAVKNGLKVDELLKLNGLDESKAKKLKPGDKLRIQ